MFREKIKLVFDMYTDILNTLKDEDLDKKLGDLRSNTIREQLCCVIGTRESYGNNLIKNQSFTWDTQFDFGKKWSRRELIREMEEKKEVVLDYLKAKNNLSENQQSAMFDLLAHEYMHQGQLVRYFYGLNLNLPKSLVEFWHLPK